MIIKNSLLHEMKKKYRSGWINIFDRKETAFRDIADHKIQKPFNNLPQRIILKKEEEELLMLFEEGVNENALSRRKSA